jgi:moderate conductance mechanosensitive channel
VLRMVVLRLLNALIARASGIGGRPQPHSTDIEQAANRPPTLLRLVSHGLFALLAVVIILEIWGVSIPRVLTSPLGYQTVRRVTIIAVTLGLMILLMRVSRALTAYLLQPKTTQGVTREAGRKLRTLVPLVQTLIKGGAVVVVVVVMLEQLGVSTGPVLAGVGIFGLAVGFAAQSLIKDVINGLFILFEDSLSVGDIVTLRGIDGQVEHVSLRAITVRDLSGNVHVIPNSSIDLVTNMTKDYSRYLLDVRVAYRENVDTVIEILQEIDASMRRDPKYRRGMLEPIEIMGLDRFDESAVIIRARLKTRPMQQWRIGREFNRRMKQVFDERGIEIPLPHRTLYWGMPPKGSQPPIQMAGEDQQPMRPED